jgi:hypothetical protein
MSNTCLHEVKKEYIELRGIIHYQQCAQCGMIREYNPKQKKHILTSDPDLWSPWEETTLKKI